MMRSFQALSLVATLGAALPVYIYSDEWNVNGSSIDKIMHKYVDAGATHLVLAFHLMTPAWPNFVADTVKFMYDLPAAQRKQLIDDLHAKGAQIILSTAGATAGATWFTDYTPAAYAESACKLAAEWGLDGVDFDLEHLPSKFGSHPTNPWAQWCTNVVGECRKHFGGYVTAAPQSPYLIEEWAGPYGFDTFGYDRLLVQYYNQGGSFGENTKEGILGSGEGSVIDLMTKHPEMPKNAFVVGKPLVDPEDGNGGMMSVDDLRTWGCEAHAKYGWTGGFMFWRGHHDRESEMNKIRRIAVPCPSEGTSGPTTAPTSGPTTAPTPAPTVPTPAPTVPTPAPTVPTPAPTVPTPAPTVPTPAPTVPTPAPTVPTQAPAPVPETDYPTVCTPVSTSPIAKECISRVQSQAHWVDSCRGSCLTLGPGGCLNYMCTGGTATADSLLECLKTYYPYCTY